MPTDAALCAAYGTQELLDRILARRVNWRYKIVTDISQAFMSLYPIADFTMSKNY